MNTSKKTILLNVNYAIIQVCYWALYCAASGFSAVFLQSRGFSNTILGIILACGCIVSMLISPLLAQWIDRRRGKSAFQVNTALCLVLAALYLMLIMVKGNSVAVSLAFVLMIGSLISINPINTEISLQVSRAGYGINYGVTRGGGSLGYAIISVLLGGLVVSLGTEMLPVCSLIFVGLELAALLCIQHYSGAGTHSRNDVERNISAIPEEETLSVLGFFNRYRRFSCFLMGVALFFFAHNITNVYLINIVNNVGGTTDTMGTLSGFIAAMEIPGMLLSDRLCKRFGVHKVLIFAGFFFLVKMVLTALAASVFTLYLSQLFQGLSFALVTPGLVRYAETVIPKKDSAKAQSISFATVTLGNVAASLLGGMLMDRFSVTTTLWIAAAAAVLAFILYFCFIEKRIPAVKA